MFVNPGLFDIESGTEEFQFKDHGHLENLRFSQTPFAL